MPIAQVDGRRLYYEDTGGTAPAIGLSHDLLMDHGCSHPRLQRCATIIVVSSETSALTARRPARRSSLSAFTTRPTTWRHFSTIWVFKRQHSQA